MYFQTVFPCSCQRLEAKSCPSPPALSMHSPRAPGWLLLFTSWNNSSCLVGVYSLLLLYHCTLLFSVLFRHLIITNTLWEFFFFFFPVHTVIPSYCRCIHWEAQSSCVLLLTDPLMLLAAYLPTLPLNLETGLISLVWSISWHFLSSSARMDNLLAG